MPAPTLQKMLKDCDLVHSRIEELGMLSLLPHLLYRSHLKCTPTRYSHNLTYSYHQLPQKWPEVVAYEGGLQLLPHSLHLVRTASQHSLLGAWVLCPALCLLVGPRGPLAPGLGQVGVQNQKIAALKNLL